MPRVPLAQLPARYREPDPFAARLQDLARDDSYILEVGAGRSPAIATPRAGRYVALDPSASEVAFIADEREVLVRCVEDFDQTLAGQFDLVVSRDTFEHLEDTQIALRNIREYLRPGGVLLAYFSGGWSMHALANRLIRGQVAERLTQRPAETKFPARYDACTYRALRRILRGWGHASLTPLYLDAEYLSFSAPLERLYLCYENMLVHTNARNFASHYLLEARP